MDEPRKPEARAGDEKNVDTLAAEFDRLLERMQTLEARAALRRAYSASPDELGRAAVAAYNH